MAGLGDAGSKEEQGEAGSWEAQIICPRRSQTKPAMDAMCLLQGAELLSSPDLNAGVVGGGDPGVPDRC